MDKFVKLQEPLLYRIQSSYEFVIVTEIRFIAVSCQTELKGKLYNYENEELTAKGDCVVVIDGQENVYYRLDEKGDPID
jgi:hypothetical protein